MWNTTYYTGQPDEPVKDMAKQIFTQLLIDDCKDNPNEDHDVTAMAELAIESAIIFEQVWEDMAKEERENQEQQ